MITNSIESNFISSKAVSKPILSDNSPISMMNWIISLRYFAINYNISKIEKTLGTLMFPAFLSVPYM